MSGADRPLPNAVSARGGPVSTAPEIDQPQESIRSKSSGLVTVPVYRFNGSTSSPPWNLPEEEIFNWLSTATIEVLEERVLSGANGVFWGWTRGLGGDSTPRSCLVRFAGVGRKSSVDTYGAEYVMETELDLLSREVASYEIAKAMGCEDLAPPICIRDLDTVALVSDPVRERIARQIRVSTDAVDEELSTAATVQLTPRNMINFAEKWSEMGASHEERWSKASDTLRFSIYRAYFLDFILGTADRQFASFGYSPSSDKIIATDLSVSFPHSGYTSEKYMQMRSKGWSGQTDNVSKFINAEPPTSYDFSSIFHGIDSRFLAEAVATAQQMSARVTNDIATRMAQCLIEHDVPAECVSSMLMRVAYLAFSPGSVIKRPVEYVRNFCTPIRAGMNITDPRVSNDIDYVNEIMIGVLDGEFDAVEVLMQVPPDGVEFLI